MQLLIVILEKCHPHLPVLNYRIRLRVRFKNTVRFRVRVRVKDRVIVGMVFKVRKKGKKCFI